MEVEINSVMYWVLLLEDDDGREPECGLNRRYQCRAGLLSSFTEGVCTYVAEKPPSSAKVGISAKQ